VSFSSPYALIALVAVPVLVALYVARDRRQARYAARFGNPALLPNLVEHSPGRRRYLPLAILVVALAAMIVGVARPHATVSVPREEATVILAIDVSRSMGATDVKPTRLGAAQQTAAAFLARVPKKFRIAVVTFASRAVVALPPTTDRTLVQQSITTLRPGIGTALGDAIVLALRLEQRQRASDGSVPPAAVLMISDGARMGGQTSPQDAAKKAKAAHVPVYTVVLGTDAGTVSRPLPGGFTEVTKVPPSPATLQQLASATGGQFFSATNDARLRDVYQRLGSRLGYHKESREVTDAFAGGSALLLLAGGGLSVLWFRRVLP
jgi:Ca-activated chloride channel homolog